MVRTTTRGNRPNATKLTTNVGLILVIQLLYLILKIHMQKQRKLIIVLRPVYKKNYSTSSRPAYTTSGDLRVGLFLR